MAERIAEGEVYVGLNATDVQAGLERVERDFDATMRDISHQEAVAKINADLAPLEDKLAKAKRKVKELEGQKATVRADANTAELDRQLKNANRAVKRLDGKKATLEIELKGVEKAIAAERALDKASERRHAAEQKRVRDDARVLSDAQAQAARAEKARMAEVNRASRSSHSLRMQQEREFLAAHSEALAIDRQRTQLDRDRTVGLARENSQIINLQRQWAKLTDKAERLGKQRRFTTEGRAKLELDSKGVIADMLRVKAELNALGAHPPAKIKIDIDRKDIIGRSKDFMRTVGSTILEKASGLGDATLRLGPFTASIKGAMTALGFLGPLLTDVAGAAGALVGVLGAGVAGAAAVGAGAITGLGMGFLGLKFSLRNVGQEFTNVRTYINAYQKAVEKYGKSSDQAKKAQDELNHALKTVSPVARESALGIERFYRTWDKVTRPSQGSFGRIAKGAFSALNSITPMWARQSNQLAGILEKNLASAFNFIKGGRGPQGLPGANEFKNDIAVIGRNFNNMVPSIMRGLGNIGRAFLNLAREGSKSFGDVGRGFENFSKSVLAFTQSSSFGDTIHRWVSDAGDLLRFFGALTRVVAHFFGAGSSAGDSFLQTMTNALNRWDDFIQSTAGHNKIADYFEGAVKGTQALYRAFAPIVQLFALWSIGLAPAVRVITQIAAAVTGFVSTVGKLAGLQNPIATLGATMGAMFAVGKIGAFVAMLSRIPAVMRAIVESEGALGGLKALFSGKFLSNLKASGVGTGIAAQIEEGAAAGSAEFRAAIISGATVGAAELRAGMAEGSAGNVASGLLGPRGKPIARAVGAAEGQAVGAAEGAGAAAAASKIGKLRGVAAAARGALAGLVGESALMTGGLTLLGGAAIFAGYKILTTKNASQQAQESYAAARKAAAGSANEYMRLGKGAYNLAQAQGLATQSVKDAKKALQDAKPGTLAHRNAMLAYRSAVLQSQQANRDWTRGEQDAEKVANKHTESIRTQLLAADQLVERARKQHSMHPERDQQQLNKALGIQKGLHDQLISAMDKEASTSANYARIWRGMPQLTDKAAQSVGKLSRMSGGASIAKTISVKYKASSNVDAVSKAASKSLTSGVPKSVVTRITADSKSATENIRRLNAIKLTPKNLRIMESGGSAALSRLRDLVGTKLAPKVQRILGNDADARHKVASMIALGVPPKIARILGNNTDALRKVAQANSMSLKTLIQQIRAVRQPLPPISLPPLTQAVIMKRTRGPAAGQGAAGAPGKVNASTAAHQERAVSRAFAGQTDKITTATAQRGRKVVAPTAVIGEEPGRPEFVISTNPAYRKQNQRYVKQAAQMLGVQTAASGAGGSFSGNAFNPSATLPRKPGKTKKKNHKPFSAKRGWADYIASLHTQQDYWEREVSIRDSQVQEPADMVVVTGTKAVTDASGNPVLDADGKQVTVEQYGPNPAIEATYKPQLAAVLDAMTQLMQVIAALVQSIPLAQSAANSEIGYRDAAIAQGEHEIKKEKNRWDRQTGEYRKDSDHQQTHNKRLAKSQKKIDDNKAERAKLVDSKKTLSADRVEAGFDWREQVIARANLQGEYDAASGNAATSAASQTADAVQGAQDSGGSAGGGSAGGSSTTLSYGAQAVLADTEMNALYQQFASNMAQAGAQALQMNTVVGGAGASSGSQVNPAQVNPTTAGTVATGAVAAGAISGGAAASGGVARSALSSGAAATMAVASGSGARPAATPAASAAPAPNVQNVYVQPTFANVPPDPMPFARAVAFDIAGAL